MGACDSHMTGEEREGIVSCPACVHFPERVGSGDETREGRRRGEER